MSTRPQWVNKNMAGVGMVVFSLKRVYSVKSWRLTASLMIFEKSPISHKCCNGKHMCLECPLLCLCYTWNIARMSPIFFIMCPSGAACIITKALTQIYRSNVRKGKLLPPTVWSNLCYTWNIARMSPIIFIMCPSGAACIITKALTQIYRSNVRKGKLLPPTVKSNHQYVWVWTKSKSCW